MPYADTDFFLALADKEDRLNHSADIVYKLYRGRIYTSLAVILELALVSVRKKQPVEKMIASVVSIANLEDSSKEKVLAAAHMIDKNGVSIFDAFHAALCDGEIISSDHIYDRLGVKRIKLEGR